MWDWLFLGLCGILLVYIADLEGIFKMAHGDLQKLLDNMKRAQGIVGRAATDADKHSTIMDNFEQRLNLNDASMGQIAEYEKLMAEMDKMGGNGGPALAATFPSSAKVTQSSTGAVFHPDGRQL